MNANKLLVLLDKEYDRLQALGDTSAQSVLKHYRYLYDRLLESAVGVSLRYENLEMIGSAIGWLPGSKSACFAVERDHREHCTRIGCWDGSADPEEDNIPTITTMVYHYPEEMLLDFWVNALWHTMKTMLGEVKQFIRCKEEVKDADEKRAVAAEDPRGAAEKRVLLTVEEASLAFWEVVSKKFPEAASDDMSPNEVVKIDDAMREAIKSWVRNNTDLKLLELKGD